MLFFVSTTYIPALFSGLTVFLLQCLSTYLKFHSTVPASPPTSSEATLLSDISETTAAAPDLVSPFERVHFYTGISEVHPLLLHRSDILQRPFVIPRVRFSVIPEKTAHSANHPILKNKLGRRQLLQRSSSFSRIRAVVFASLRCCLSASPRLMITAWLSSTTTSCSGSPSIPTLLRRPPCRDANASILAILAKHGIQDAAVHWIEGAVEALGGPPSHDARRPGHGPDPLHPPSSDSCPGRAPRRGGVGEQRCAGLARSVLPRGKGPARQQEQEGHVSTNKHVTSSDTTQDYDYSGRSGAPQQQFNAQLQQPSVPAGRQQRPVHSLPPSSVTPSSSPSSLRK